MVLGTLLQQNLASFQLFLRSRQAERLTRPYVLEPSKSSTTSAGERSPFRTAST